MSRNQRSVRAAARRLGIDQLHPEQERVVAHCLAGRDVLMILPTGFGKSACYQIASMVLKKPVVLISPLLALLRDQHQKLLEREIPSVRLDGTVRGRARREALERVAAGGSLLVMTTPETLTGAELHDALGKSGIGLAAVDEAHCISEWGHDFRPAYQRLGARLRELGGPPVLALTATATPKVRDSILRSLGLRGPAIEASSPHRSNLAFEVLPCEADLRPRALLRLTQRLRRPGIVYCATTREVDAVYALLRRFKITAHRYHGRMTASQRNAEQEAYMRPRRRSVMVATSAFGLGIDKPDIRYVLHYQSPASLEQYVQEAGRAGRDGRRSNCILLYDASDRAIHEALLARSRVRPDQLYRLGEALAAWADVDRSPSLEALALSAELGPRVAGALLAKLEEAELVSLVNSQIEVLGSKTSVEQDARSLAGQFETLRVQDGRRLDAVGEYARTPACRAEFLRRYFGEASDEACGLCDTCTGRTARPESFFAPLVKPAQPAGRGKKQRRSGGKKKTTRKRSARTRRPRRGGGRSRKRRPSGDDEPSGSGSTGRKP
jgi:ATP-dependent DNA helicase RecQ